MHWMQCNHKRFSFFFSCFFFAFLFSFLFFVVQTSSDADLSVFPSTMFRVAFACACACAFAFAFAFLFVHSLPPPHLLSSLFFFFSLFWYHFVPSVPQVA